MPHVKTNTASNNNASLVSQCYNSQHCSFTHHVIAALLMDTYHSKPVTSDQDGPHEKLEATVRLHMKSEYKKPFRQHNINAYEILTHAIAEKK